MIVEEGVSDVVVTETIENSVVISDKTFNVGEIPIDINNPPQELYEQNPNIEELYSSAGENPTMLQNSGRVPTAHSSNKGLVIGLSIAGLLITLALVGAIAFGVSKMLKPSVEENPQPITDEPITTPATETATPNTLDVNPDNVVNMENTSSDLTPATKTQAPAVQTVKPVTATPTSTTNVKTTPTTFVEVKKLSWEVPDYVSYNSQFKQYFQSVGKSLKLSLTSDLLLATDLVYANYARVSISFDKDGNLKSAVIVNSSGSSQIDKIVLQTVNQTLASLKAPHSVGNDENTTVILKIYF
jgi:flagellar basal body-associated protein FliL